MGMIDLLFSGTLAGKITQVLDMVTKLTKWSLGNDKRMSLIEEGQHKIERRLGAVEMALTGKGIHYEEVDDVPLKIKGERENNES